jgi:hypothetical protein
MSAITRTVRAFFKALLLTLQGKPIPSTAQRYPNLTGWIANGLQLVDAALLAADQAGLNKAQREALRLTIDRRSVSAELILTAVRYHLTTEYPSLLRAQIDHNLTTLYALNLDDQYRVDQLAQLETLPATVRQEVEALRDHLMNIPSSTNP